MQHPSRTFSRPAKQEVPAPLFLRMPTVVHITGLCRSTIYRLIAENKFPGPVRVGDRAVAWRQSDIDRWSEGRLPTAH
jgi:prophage regulatory protein